MGPQLILPATELQKAENNRSYCNPELTTVDYSSLLLSLKDLLFVVPVIVSTCYADGSKVHIMSDVHIR